MAENPPGWLIATGRVRPGRGDLAGRMLELAGLYRRKLGIDCVPGSLNVELAEAYDLPAGGPRIEPGEQGCSVGVSFAPCRIAGNAAFVVRTDANASGVGDHPRTIVELVGPLHYRTVLELEVGDEVQLELPVAP